MVVPMGWLRIVVKAVIRFFVDLVKACLELASEGLWESDEPGQGKRAEKNQPKRGEET